MAEKRKKNKRENKEVDTDEVFAEAESTEGEGREFQPHFQLLESEGETSISISSCSLRSTHWLQAKTDSRSVWHGIFS